MTEEKKKFISSIIPPALFIVIIWSVKILETMFVFDFVRFGVYPRDLTNLLGILRFPFIHANFDHLISNTLPILFLGVGLYYFYPKSATKVVGIIYIVSSSLVWLFARPSYHIGASGLIYGIAAFLFFSGIIRRDTRAITLALLVTFIYGGLIWGVLPSDAGISWEGHLFGGLTGIACAFIFRKSDPYFKYEWQKEPDEDNAEKPEISYDNNEFFN